MARRMTEAQLNNAAASGSDFAVDVDAKTNCLAYSSNPFANHSFQPVQDPLSAPCALISTVQCGCKTELIPPSCSVTSRTMQRGGGVGHLRGFKSVFAP